MSDRPKANSTPQKAPSLKGGQDLPPVPNMRTRAKSSAAPAPRSRNSSSPLSAESSRASSRRPAQSFPSRRPLTSTVRQALPEHFKFRILVVGKRGSGKSSLIKAVFKVDVTAAPEIAPGKTDIDVEFRPEDNRYLIVHESSGLDSQATDAQGLQTTRDFITRRTDVSHSPPERLHAIWICVPLSDVIDRNLGDGVKEILNIGKVPVILVFTKFDVVVSRVLFNIAGGDPQQYERARAHAHTMYQDSRPRLFRKDPSDVPAQIVLVADNPRSLDLIEDLVVATDRLITDPRTLSARVSAQGTKQRLGAASLAWSAAVRANHDIIIQASIEVGRSRYWSNLWVSPDFADQSLKNCVRIIHDDIVEIWNLNDKTRYLSSERFKVKMSLIIGDLAGSPNALSSSDRTGATYADWTQDAYRGSQENVRCLTGYIVDLMVIMDGIFRMNAGDMRSSHADQVFERHIMSGRRDAIHRDIRRFIAEEPVLSSFAPHRDLVLERVIDLIREFCVPTL
ncbi:hypothetical protein EI94DRAFT_1828906 [Lactarius quietus]|nr:hypothetical protein EI94DRAFT_1828906 [Lactarius quietus]